VRIKSLKNQLDCRAGKEAVVKGKRKREIEVSQGTEEGRKVCAPRSDRRGKENSREGYLGEESGPVVALASF